MSVGSLLEQESTFQKATQFEDNSQGLWRGCGANRTWRSYHSVEAEDKRGFTPFLKGLGIYCNRFWGCGALGPHKCNRSDLSHSIKEVEIVEEKISIHQSRLSLFTCISYRLVYWSEEREKERFGCLCVEAL